MTDYDRTNTGALFEPKYQRLIRYGRINIEGSEDSYAIVEVKTKSGKTVFEVMKRVGVLFPNEKKREGKRDPDTYGKLEHSDNPVAYNVSAWRKLDKSDQPFTSLSIRLAQTDTKTESEESGFEDESLPF